MSKVMITGKYFDRQIMKMIIILFVFFPALIPAQQNSTDTIKISEEIYNCVVKVYKNTDAIKLLIQKLDSDKEYFKSLHKELINDPKSREMIRDLVHSSRDMLGRKEDNAGNRKERQRRQ